MNNPIQEFRDAALVAGVVLPLKITPSGTICRCGTISKPRGQDGAYSFVYAGDLACGGFQNWASGEGWESWHEGTATGRTLTPTEQAALHAELKRQALQHEAEEKERQAGAAAEAGRIWSPSKPCSSHPYLTKKGVQSHGLRQDGKTLIVPLCSPEGKLASLQYIDPAGNKRFLTGGRKKGVIREIMG